MSVRNWIAEAGESGALRADWDARTPSTPEEEESIAGTATGLLLSRVSFSPVEISRECRTGVERMAARE